MKTRIVTVTDCRDIANQEIRASIISALNQLGTTNKVEIEPAVFCEAFSLINCAFLVRLLAEIYPPNHTVFLVIANALPTSRPDRARVAGMTNNGIRFVGENTGVLSWLLNDFGVSEIYEFSQQGLDGVDFVSFGGKYYHAPEAAKIASGKMLNHAKIEFPIGRLKRLVIPDGAIVHVDNFGVAKFNTTLGSIEEGEILQVLVNGKTFLHATLTNSMKNLPDNTWAVYRGSSLGLAEIGCVRKIVSSNDQFKIGDIISLRRA